MLGAAAAGVMRAGYVIFGPTRILGFFLRTVLPNSFARTLAGDGKAAMHEQVKSVWSGVAPLTATYCLLAAAFADPLVRLLFGAQFAGHSTVVVLYAVFAFTALMTSVITSALRAGRLSKELFVSQLCANALALPVGWLLIAHWGIEGAVVGMILTNLVVGLSNYLAYRREQFVAAPPRSTPVTEEAAVVGTLASAAAAARALRRVFHLLDEVGIAHCVLHGHERLHELVTSDVDCVVAADALPGRLAEVLRANEGWLGVRVVQWFADAAHFVVLAGRDEDGAPFFLQLHAHADCEVSRRTVYAGEEVLRTRRRAGACWAPAPAVEFAASLARRVAKGDLGEGHARRLCDLYRRDPAGCRREAERVCRADPLRVARNCLAAAVGRLRREWRSDRGLSVVVLGPDGAGKSSVCEAIRDRLSPAFVATQRHTFPPGLLRRSAGSNATPHAQVPRSPLNSCLRAVAYWLPCCTLGHFLVTRAARVRGGLVVHDRHVVDALVDPRRYRYGGPGWLLRAVCRLVPKADLVILLDAPAEVIQARKQEVPAEETRRQREAYRALVAGMPNGHVVDASMPLPRVVAAAEDVILDCLARRASRQLGLGVQR
jgi:thymidylate kinase